jgi:hypothetical protein
MDAQTVEGGYGRYLIFYTGTRVQSHKKAGDEMAGKTFLRGGKSASPPFISNVSPSSNEKAMLFHPFFARTHTNSTWAASPNDVLWNIAPRDVSTPPCVKYKPRDGLESMDMKSLGLKYVFLEVSCYMAYYAKWPALTEFSRTQPPYNGGLL